MKSTPRFLFNPQHTRAERTQLLAQHQARRRQRRRRLIIFLSLLTLTGVGYGTASWWYEQNKLAAKSSLPPSAESSSLQKREGMSHWVMHTQDTRQHPVKIQADHAVELKDKPFHYQLQKPKGTIDLQPGRQVHVSSQQGLMDQQTKNLTLSSNVQVHDSMGYTFSTHLLSLEPEKSLAYGDHPVQGQGPESTWSGQGFRYDWEQEHLHLQGPAELVLNQNP